MLVQNILEVSEFTKPSPAKNILPCRVFGEVWYSVP